MRMALRSKNKLGFVTGDITKPSSLSNIPWWERYNDLVTSWILRSIHPDLASSILYRNSPKDVLDDLCDRFHQPNASRLFHIKQQSSSSHKKSSLSWHISRASNLYGISNLLWHPPTLFMWGYQVCLWAYPARSSDAIPPELHQSFSTLHSHILLIESFPSVNKVYFLVS